MSGQVLIWLLVLVVLIGLAWEFGVRRGRSREVELNNESWEIYRAARRVHDQAAAAFEELLNEARRHDPPVDERHRR